MHLVRTAVVCAVAFSLTPAASVNAADASPVIVLAQAALDGRVKRRVKKVKQALDGFDSTLGLNYTPAKRLRYLKQNLDAAQYEHDKIFEYYGGKFDQNHPDIVAMKKRLTNARKVLAATAANKGKVPAKQAAARAKLDSRIVYRLKKAAASLASAEKLIASGGDAARRLRAAKRSLEAAEREHKAITDYYTGKFDPAHADYKTALAKLEKVRAAMTALAARHFCRTRRPKRA